VSHIGVPDLNPPFGSLLGPLFWNLPDAALLADVGTDRVLAWNPAATALFGYSTSEAAGLAVSDLFAAPSWEQYRAHLATLAAMGEPALRAPLELTAWRRSGEAIVVELSCSLLELEAEGGPYILALCRDVTARSRTEQALRESEAFYHSLVETIPQHLFRKDLQGRFTFGNRRFCASLERPLEEIIGKTDYDFYPRELAEKYRADDRRVVETGETLEVVEEHQAPECGKIFVRVIKAPIRDARGEIIGIQCMFWDVTDKVQADLALLESERRFAAFMDNSSAIAFVKDEAGRSIYVNRVFEQQFGVRAADVLGKTEFELWPAEIARQMHEQDQAALAEERRIETVHCLPHPDGRIRYWSVFKFPFRDAAGRRLLGGFGIDVTERTRMVQALHESEQRLRTVIGSIPVILFVLDLAGRVTLCEGKGLEALGLQPSEVVGRPVVDLYPDQPQVAEDLRRALAGEAFSTTVELGEVVLQVWLTPLVDANGALTGVIGVATDITARKRTEASWSTRRSTTR